MTAGYEDRPGGALFTKDPSKKVNPNQPDFDGYIVLDPTIVQTLYDNVVRGLPAKVEIAGWKKKAASGVNYLSLTGGKLPRDRTASPRQATVYDDDDQDIPF